MEATISEKSPADLQPAALAHLLAWMIDALVTALLIAPSFLLATSHPPHAQLANVAGLLAVVLMVAYYVVGVGGRHGATLGGRLAGIRVVDQATGGPIGYRRAALRGAAIAVSGIWLHLDAITHLFKRQQRPWHDSVVEAIVVRSR